MKNIYLSLFIFISIVACNPPISVSEEQTGTDAEMAATVAGSYGNTDWNDSTSIPMASLIDSLGTMDSIYTAVSGTIDAACQAKGCWMSMKEDDNQILVRFKDYGFFVPMNSAGHNATMKGWAYAETQSVADQIELAKDAEASEDEIALITEPKLKLTFMAEGVVIE